MEHILASLQVEDITLDSATTLRSRDVRQQYMHRTSGTPLQALVIGVVTSILAEGENSKIVVLSPPDEHSRVIRVMFHEQLQVLEDVVNMERLEAEPVVLMRQHWSQGPSAIGSGHVFVRVPAHCAKGRLDFSVDIQMRPWERASNEIPVTAPDVRVLEVGALVLFKLGLYRVDTAHSEGPVFTRCYIMEASQSIRFMRSIAEPQDEGGRGTETRRPQSPLSLTESKATQTD
ncbi:hypothetical protein C8R44DRAFT_866952 [Mycena epipterygia]|nr:hypothetical protein C8R44DRAFT_866952 [Mycena epipterygia]